MSLPGKRSMADMRRACTSKVGVGVVTLLTTDACSSNSSEISAAASLSPELGVIHFSFSQRLRMRYLSGWCMYHFNLL